ncbi:sorting nexin-25 [Entomortierella parvispora]|uniref:Sorting nexin-25 n=1 Tax=Entomortierella parvispora TaxID=205924 RepID=A0A9P3HKN9_9FUNG|nr:sorting nexin-25 [Entomortierella parvispora]
MDMDVGCDGDNATELDKRPHWGLVSPLQAAVFTVAMIILSWVFGNATQRKLATLIIATPIILVLGLAVLTASNIAFSIIYDSRDRRSSFGMLPSSSSRRAESSSKRAKPGQVARQRFHFLRPALFTRPVSWSNIERQRRQEQVAKYRTPIADTMPQLSEAMDTVIELVMRDYVAGWMRSITPEIALQQRIEELLRIVLIRLKNRIVDLDLTELLVTRLVPKVTAHVNDFRRAEMALRGNSLERSLTESDELDLLVASKFRNGHLHKALTTSVSTAATEEAYLRIVVQTILPTILPKNEIQSEILRHLLREVLVGAVLMPLMGLISDPDYWNQNVDIYTDKAIREQNMVKKLREALKQHADGLDTDLRTDNSMDPYNAGADLYTFEDFLRMIKRCDSLLDVKRIRNTIMTQMRKKKALIVNREKDDIVNGSKVEDIIVYINRLDIAKRRAEKRIEALGGPAYPKKRVREYIPEIKSAPQYVSLTSILTNPSGLSYFMEFEDRRDNMNELQFWLLIESLNIVDQPTFEAESHPRGDPNEPIPALDSPNTTVLAKQRVAPDSISPGTPVSVLSSNRSLLSNSIRSSRKSSVATVATFDTTDTLRDDVKMIYDTYFAESAPRPIVVGMGLVQTLKEYSILDDSTRGLTMRTVNKTQDNEGKVDNNIKKLLLEAQTQIFEQMLAKDYPEFVKSDLYFKFLASYHNSISEQDTEAAAEAPVNHDRNHVRSLSSSQSRPALLSAIGLSSPERRRTVVTEQPKRSSTGSSFFDMFGLGRDKEKEREREHQPIDQRRSESSFMPTVTLGGMRPGFLTPNSRPDSKSGSPSSTKTLDRGTNTQRQESTGTHGMDIPIPSSARPFRSRSMSSVSTPETSITGGNANIDPRRREISSALGHTRDESIDSTTGAALSQRRGTDLRDSLLEELQEQDDQDDDSGLLMEDSHDSLAIMSGMQSQKTGNDRVIDAVEAALSSIMESHDHKLDSSSTLPSMDPTDPTFSTARDDQVGSVALLEWGKSSKEKIRKRSIENLSQPRVSRKSKSQDSLESEKHPGPFLGPVSSQMSAPSKESKPKSKRNDIFDFEQGKVERGVNEGGEKPESISDAVQDNVHLAAPGDLLLASRIKELEQDIETIKKQESIVEALIRKAEHQGRQNELRILKKSKSALRREILGMEYQKTQYEVQEEENMILPGRSTINITSSTVGYDGSKEFALYVIEVHQLVQDGSFASGWVIARRYSEFFALHQKLKEKFHSIVRHYELPGKRGFLKLQKSFVESRRIGLERYLQSLVQHIEICQSQELRAFLSQENVALPQFSVAPSSSTFLPSLFDIDSFGKEKSEKVVQEQAAGEEGSSLSSPQPIQHQHFFEQLFQSSPSQPRTLLEVHTGGSNSASRSQIPPLPSADTQHLYKSSSTEGHLPIDPGEGFMKHIYQTVSEGLDDMFSGGPPTVLGNITKQLGNQMMQFSIEDDDGTSVSTPRLEGHQNGAGGSGVIQQGSFVNQDRAGMPLSPGPSLNEWSDETGSTLRPSFQRHPNFRARRISSPDPHTLHQRQQLQKQEQARLQQAPDQTPQMQKQQRQHMPKQQPVRPTVVEPEGVTTFTEPLCDLFIELFELKEKNNWLRRQAVVIILQQVLGGTIERKLRDTIKGYLEETMLTYYVFKLKDALWPQPEPSHGDAASSGRSGTLSGSAYLSGGYEVIDQNMPAPPVTTDPSSIHDAGASAANPGTQKRPAQQRTAEQKALTKDQANRKLSAFLPELLGNMVGHQNARRGARRVFAAFQNRRLNQQLVYTALDEIVGALWPELAIVEQSDALLPGETPL